MVHRRVAGAPGSPPVTSSALAREQNIAHSWWIFGLCEVHHHHHHRSLHLRVSFYTPGLKTRQQSTRRMCSEIVALVLPFVGMGAFPGSKVLFSGSPERGTAGRPRRRAASAGPGACAGSPGKSRGPRTTCARPSRASRPATSPRRASAPRARPSRARRRVCSRRPRRRLERVARRRSGEECGGIE